MSQRIRVLLIACILLFVTLMAACSSNQQPSENHGNDSTKEESQHSSNDDPVSITSQTVSYDNIDSVPQDNLLDIQIYSKSGLMNIGHALNSDWLEDTLGNTHRANDTIFCSHNGYFASDPTDYVSYYLNKQYESLSFTVFMPKICISGKSIYRQPLLKIYGDDVLIYEAPRIDKDHNYDPFVVNLNVSGIRVLKIELEGSYSEFDDYSRRPIIALTELRLTKAIN